MLTLQAWNIHTFDQVDHNIPALEERLEVLEQQIQMDYNQDVETDYLVTKTKLSIWEAREEVHLAQKVKKNDS